MTSINNDLLVTSIVHNSNSLLTSNGIIPLLFRYLIRSLPTPNIWWTLTRGRCWTFHLSSGQLLDIPPEFRSAAGHSTRVQVSCWTFRLSSGQLLDIPPEFRSAAEYSTRVQVSCWTFHQSSGQLLDIPPELRSAAGHST